MFSLNMIQTSTFFSVLIHNISSYMCVCVCMYMETHSSILAGESYGQRSLVGCSSWGHKETWLR